MKKETWVKLGFIAVMVNCIISMIIHNWYALGAWICAFCYLMGNAQSTKTLPKTQADSTESVS